MRTFIAAVTATAALALGASAAQAAEIVTVATPEGAIANGVVVPAGAATFYVSGITPTPVTPAANGQPAVYGDTKTQTIAVLNRIDSILKGQGFTMGDVVMMRVLLVADPNKDNKMDFAGMNEGYRQFFANPQQPKKPARITSQVVQLANPAFLVEIEVQAAKMP
jgi:enamine deaminase RidA (YjgF/YER057c/UK114 family)